MKVNVRIRGPKPVLTFIACGECGSQVPYINDVAVGPCVGCRVIEVNRKHNEWRAANPERAAALDRMPKHGRTRKILAGVLRGDIALPRDPNPAPKPRSKKEPWTLEQHQAFFKKKVAFITEGMKTGMCVVVREPTDKRRRGRVPKPEKISQADLEYYRKLDAIIKKQEEEGK